MAIMNWRHFRLAAATTAVAILAACGGGGADPTSQRAGITSIKVMGDSLSDVGVFKGIPTNGRIFSVQDSASEPNTDWTERIAALLGIPSFATFSNTPAQLQLPSPWCLVVQAMPWAAVASTTSTLKQAQVLRHSPSLINCKLRLLLATTKAQICF